MIDANILIYAFDADSPKHLEAKGWLTNLYQTDDLVGFASLSLLAFVRIVSNPRLTDRPVAPALAVAQLDAIRLHPKTVIIEPGERHWSIFQSLLEATGVFGPSVTDAYLAALAIETGAVLCSHDGGFRRYPGLRFENPLH